MPPHQPNASLTTFVKLIHHEQALSLYPLDIPEAYAKHSRFGENRAPRWAPALFDVRFNCRTFHNLRDFPENRQLPLVGTACFGRVRREGPCFAGWICPP